MNRHRSAPTLSSFSVIVIVSAAIIMVSGGVLFVCLKNKQIEVAREIEHVEDRIAKHQMDIKTVEMRVDQMLNRYVVRDQLRENGSDLVAIPIHAVESVVPEAPQRGVVALVQP